MDENIIASAEPAEEEYIEKVQISAQLVPVVNYALSHNGFSMLSTVNVKNVSNEPASDVRLDFVCSPEVCQPLSLHVDCVPAGCELALDASSLTPDGEYLASLTEGVKCTLTITAFEKDKKIGEVSSQLSALAFDEWHGSLYYPELVSAFVTPNAPEVISVMKRASELVGEWTDDPSIDSYLSSDPNRVLPVDVMREFEKEGRIGELSHYYYATVGNGTAVASAKKFADTFSKELIADGVQAVILTST